MINEEIKHRLHTALVDTDTDLARGVRERYATSHWDLLLGDQNALACKMERCRYIADVLGTRGKRVLDFGSGAGFLANYLAADGAGHVVGIELRPAQRRLSEFLSEEVFMISNTIFAENADGYAPCSFDVVILANVLSHIQREWSS